MFCRLKPGNTTVQGGLSWRVDVAAPKFWQFEVRLWFLGLATSRRETLGAASSDPASSPAGAAILPDCRCCGHIPATAADRPGRTRRGPAAHRPVYRDLSYLRHRACGRGRSHLLVWVWAGCDPGPVPGWWL